MPFSDVLHEEGINTIAEDYGEEEEEIEEDGEDDVFTKNMSSAEATLAALKQAKVAASNMDTSNNPTADQNTNPSTS